MTDTNATRTPGKCGDADSLIVDITEAIAAERGVDMLDLPPLQDYVDVDALTSLFDSRVTFGRVTFAVDDLEVTVYHDREVDVIRTAAPAAQPVTAGAEGTVDAYAGDD